MPKSRDAFRTISEVADWLETPAHVLRFWESKFSQVKPVKRAGGRRYYRPADMELLGGIKKLLHDDGMTIKGVQKVLREQGVRHVSSLAAQSADEDETVNGDLIEDAPYAEVPLNDTEGEVVAFPSEAVVPRVDAPPAPQPIALEPEPEEPGPEEPVAMSEPPIETDLPVAEPDDNQPDIEDEDDVAPDRVAMTAPVPEIETPGGTDPTKVDDIAPMDPSPDDRESPVSAAPESAPMDPMPEANEENASDVPDSIENSEAEAASAASLAIDTDILETDAPETETVQPDAPELPFNETPIAASVDDASPEPLDEPQIDPATASVAHNPLDLPDFSASETPPPAAAPVVRSAIGPLGQIARISTLTAAQKAALSAHLPALEALRDRLSSPLS
ncbi:MerR family transcriptional regulator [Antarctobacter heliothermus]|nr:MerR family transcriptional regulator [Antarctobacter heliothermus]